MDQHTAREQAAQIGAAAVHAGIQITDPSNPDMGELLALSRATGIPAPVQARI